MIVIIQKMDCLCRHFFVVVVVRRKYIPNRTLRLAILVSLARRRETQRAPQDHPRSGESRVIRA